MISIIKEILYIYTYTKTFALNHLSNFNVPTRRLRSQNVFFLFQRNLKEAWNEAYDKGNVSEIDFEPPESHCLTDEDSVDYNFLLVPK